MKFSYPPEFNHDNEPSIWQNPWEFRMTRLILRGAKVKTLLEIGTGWGEFTKHLTVVMGIRVWSIDLEFVQKTHNEYRWIGESQSETAHNWAAVNGPFDAVFIDGSHEYMDCLHDFNFYIHQAKKLVIIHDIGGNREGKYPVDPGTADVWEEVIKPNHKTMEIYDKDPYFCGVGVVLL